MTPDELVEVEYGHAVVWTPGVLSRTVPPVHWERDQSRDDFTGWSSPISDEGVRIWARRKGLGPCAALVGAEADHLPVSADWKRAQDAL